MKPRTLAGRRKRGKRDDDRELGDDSRCTEAIAGHPSEPAAKPTAEHQCHEHSTDQGRQSASPGRKCHDESTHCERDDDVSAQERSLHGSG